MNILQKRIKPVENLTFVSIMTAITVAFFAILNFIPFSFLIIIMVFPFVSFIVGIVCKKRYFPLFFVASFLLSLTFSFHDISNLLFYLVPSLITGFFMAVLSNKKISIYFQIGLAALIQLILTLLFVPVIEVIYEVNIIFDIVKLFGLDEYKHIDSFILPVMLFVSLVQTFVSYIFIIICAQKLKITIIYKDEKQYFYGVFAAIFGLLTFIFAFSNIFKWINFTFFLCSIYFFVLMLIDFKFKNPLEIIVLIVSVILAIVMYVLLFNFIPYPNHICVVSIGIFIYGFYYLIKRGIFNR